MRRLMAPICVAAVLGGLAAWFFHSPLYRSLDPLQVPRVLLLYVLPERYFTPMDVVWWTISQGARGDGHQLARVVEVPSVTSAEKRGPTIDVLSPGTWLFSSSSSGSTIVVLCEGTNTLQEVKHSIYTWSQNFSLTLVSTRSGWKVARIRDVYARKQLVRHVK